VSGAFPRGARGEILRAVSEAHSPPSPPDAPPLSPPARDGRHASGLPHTLRVWLLPLAALGAASFTLLTASWWLDERAGSTSLVATLTALDRDRAAEALGGVAQVVTQVLGVAISVVAIIVELASNRYTHRVTELFFRAKINFAVMGLFVLAGLDGLWVSLMFRDGRAPVLATLLAMALMTASLLLLLPYIAFVFDFVNPLHIVSRIRRETLATIRRARALRDDAPDAAEAAKRTAAEGPEQLSDVALNAMAGHDGAIALAAVNALGELAREYGSERPSLPGVWYATSTGVARDPDFVSMTREVLDKLARDKVWFEFKVLRQFQAVYQAAIGSNREVCYIVAIHTREMAERAMATGDDRVVGLCVKFFNTYLRATVNGRDVRTAYNVLNQYRLLAEAALHAGRDRDAIEVARHFKYYGQLAFHMDLGFVLETAAYDLCALNERAFDLRAAPRAELLRIFLQVDKEGEGASREASLRGVRKAQVRLATYYLLHGDEAAAREVFRDMRDEQPARLASIRDEMLSVSSPEFWEVTDRGTNFDYIPPERKQRLVEFFLWFGDTLAPPRVSLVPSLPPAANIDPPPATVTADVPH